jgi:hypothetical protein
VVACQLERAELRAQHDRMVPVFVGVVQQDSGVGGGSEQTGS